MSGKKKHPIVGQVDVRQLNAGALVLRNHLAEGEIGGRRFTCSSCVSTGTLMVELEDPREVYMVSLADLVQKAAEISDAKKARPA